MGVRAFGVDEEVQRLDKKLTARPKPRNVSFSEHGSKLSQGLQTVKQTLESIAKDNSLADSDMLVLAIELPEGEKIQDKKDFFDSNGMRVRAVKSVRSAVVTSTNSQFQSLKRRVEAYAHNGAGKTHFNHVDNFMPFIGADKGSSELRKTMNADTPPDMLDVQLMLPPNLDSAVYDVALPKLIAKIQSTQGQIQEDTYYLSDNTPVIRAIIDLDTLTLNPDTKPTDLSRFYISHAGIIQLFLSRGRTLSYKQTTAPSPISIPEFFSASKFLTASFPGFPVFLISIGYTVPLYSKIRSISLPSVSR